MSRITSEEWEASNWPGSLHDAGEVVELTPQRNASHPAHETDRSGIFGFVSELRRRKVCRAATAYCIALWLICQVVEVVAQPLGLPDWTLEFVIVLGTVGFPVALIIAWLFEVTPSGLVRDSDAKGGRASLQVEQPRSRFDQALDCSLLLVALAIGASLAISSFSTSLQASPVLANAVYIGRFPVVAESRGDEISSALQVELQHELSRLPGIEIFVPTKSREPSDGSNLTGSVSITGDGIQVTVLVVSNETGELTWSEVLRFPAREAGGSPRTIAKGIVAALDDWASREGENGGSRGAR